MSVPISLTLTSQASWLSLPDGVAGIAGFASDGGIGAIPGLSVGLDAWNFGAQQWTQTVDIQLPDPGSDNYYGINSQTVNIEPTASTLKQNPRGFALLVNVDPTNTGHNIGTDGNGGVANMEASLFKMGSGTCGYLSNYDAQMHVQAGHVVTLNNIESDTSVDGSSTVSFMQIIKSSLNTSGTASIGSVQAVDTAATIVSGTSVTAYTGVQTEETGAGAVGSYKGINIAPTLSNVSGNMTGINIDLTGATAGSKVGMNLNGASIINADISSLTVNAASKALSNLASVAINTSLLPGTTNSIDLGSTSEYWRNAYVKTQFIAGQATGTVSAPAYSFVGGTDKGMLDAGPELGFAYGGVLRMYLDSTTLHMRVGQQFQSGNGITFNGSSSGSVSIAAPATIGSPYSLALPTAQGAVNSLLRNDGSGNLSWVAQFPLLQPTGLSVPQYSSAGDSTTGLNIVPAEIDIYRSGNNEMFLDSSGFTVRVPLSLTNSFGGGTLRMVEVAAPAAPAAGSQILYIDSTSHQLCRKNSSGTVVVIG